MLFLLVFLQYILSILEIVVLVLLGVAFITLFERRLLANVQRRQGPNMVGPLGLLQPFADGIKLVFKEIIDVFGASTDIFTLAPILALTLAEILWFIIAATSDYIFLNYIFSILSLFIILSLSAIPSMLVGWASHSRYALLGALRAAAQTISYEVVLALNLLPIMLFVGSFSLQEIAELDTWLIFSFLPVFFIHFIAVLAEGYRTPFDLPEAEGELVAGYIVEVSSVEFAEFFIAEYANLLAATLLMVQLFFGGDSAPLLFAVFIPAGIFWLFLKTFILFYLVLSVRALLPRYRYEQLMHFCWFTALPLVLSLVFFYYFQMLLFDDYCYYLMPPPVIPIKPVIATLKTQSTPKFSSILHTDYSAFKKSLQLNTEAHTGSIYHPGWYEFDYTKAKPSLTFGHGTTQPFSGNQLIFTEHTGFPSGKMTANAKTHGQAIRGNMAADFKDLSDAKQAEAMITKGERTQGALHLKSLPLKKETFTERNIILKPQALDNFMSQYAPDPSKKFTPDNPIVDLETRIWSAKFDNFSLIEVEKGYRKLVSLDTIYTPGDMVDLYIQTKKTLEYAITMINLHPDDVTRYKQIIHNCEIVLTHLKKYL